MVTEPPNNSELSRRLDDQRSEMREGFRGLYERLDKVPTNELLLAYLAKTDAEVATVKEDVTEIKRDLDGFKKAISDARKWGIGAAISAGGLAVAALGLLRSLLCNEHCASSR